jgi:hypothetical protein
MVGEITDPSGASIRNAGVAAENLASGYRQTTSSWTDGTFRFSILPPGKYKVTVKASGFRVVETTATIVIGGATRVAINLPLGTQFTSVEVVAESASAQTEGGDLQSIVDTTAIQNLPNPGGDVTYYAQLTPGAVMNTNGGYGNFSIFGLPGTSNLFTLNGQNDNDPFQNVNKSGATNLLLGANELAEVSVTANGYSGQYGQLAGANVNYGTKSGANTFHGNANYYWNGRIMNANDFFNNANRVPRQFVNANQWSASVGGPIKKDKAFFFVNDEGLRVVLPTATTPVRLPSTQFQAATLSNLAAMGMGEEIPFYQQLFKTFNTATGLNRASAAPRGRRDVQGPGCGDLTILAAGVPCAVQYSAAPNAFAHEWQFAARADEIVGDRDRIYGRFQTDHGVAPAFSDPINPVFNAISVQPEDQGQFSWTHTFGPRATNQIIGSALYSDAPFRAANPEAANALLPYYFSTSDGSFSSLNAAQTFTPQGREIMQWQVVDDFSFASGKHTFKAGINYHHDSVKDYDFGVNTGGELFFGSIDDLYNGVLGGNGFFGQNFPAKSSQDIRTSQLGFYIEDDVRVSSKLKLTLALRADHSSIPECSGNCFAASVAPFNELNHDADISYNAAMQTGRRCIGLYSMAAANRVRLHAVLQRKNGVSRRLRDLRRCFCRERGRRVCGKHSPIQQHFFGRLGRLRLRSGRSRHCGQRFRHREFGESSA